MPFGISSASEVLQKRVCQTFGDIPGVHVIANAIIVAAKDENEVDEILRKLFHRANEMNVKFNLKKIQLKKSQVETQLV